MNIIEQDIKDRQFHNIYLLFGDEEYLKDKYANMLIESVVDSKTSMNYNAYTDNSIDSGEVFSTAVTLPFLADYRVIYIKDSGWFKSPNDDFLNYIDEPSDSTILIFKEANVDKRSRAYKAVGKTGCIVECAKPDDNSIRSWIGGKLKAEKKSMEKEAFVEFVSRCGSSMENMDNEFEKLICYVGDKDTITVRDVEAVCIKGLQSKVFDMINAIAEKNPARVLDMYHDLLASKEPPLKILILIQRQFRRSIKIKDLREEGYSNERIAKDLKMQQFIIGKELTMTKNFSKATMNALLDEALELEQDIKTGKIKDQLAVEMLMMKYAN